MTWEEYSGEIVNASTLDRAISDVEVAELYNDSRKKLRVDCNEYKDSVKELTNPVRPDPEDFF